MPLSVSGIIVARIMQRILPPPQLLRCHPEDFFFFFFFFFFFSQQSLREVPSRCAQTVINRGLLLQLMASLAELYRL
ncbi:hypothetical protein TYRP_012888, partial [Tyrophagus putrescentiae]